MKKFEYKTISIDTDYDFEDIDEQFNSLGKDGWELVTAATDNTTDDDGDTYTGYIWYTFKREIN